MARFLKRKEFIGDMPSQYAKTIRRLRKKQAELKERLRRLSETEVDELEVLEGQLEILADMISDMMRARRTVVNYYEPGGRWDDEYCILARISGNDDVRFGSSVERLVIDSVEDSSWEQ